jgi:hypothetical protein
MRFLISILTSSKPDLARLCYDSVYSQIDPEQDSIVIIVNSTNPHHIEDIRQLMPENTNIQETESNGSPGKGHNSVLHYFRTQIEYNYCIIIDGDDFLYPRALTRLSHYMKYEPDILMVAFHDILQSHIPSNLNGTNYPYISFQNKCCLSYNVDDITLNEWHRVKGGLNPFKANINEMNTIARPFLFSRKSLQYDILYDENMKLYDDFIVVLKCFEQNMLGNLRMFAMADSNIYLYNTTSLDTATNRYSAENRIMENEYYQRSIHNRFLNLRLWDLKKMPLLQLEQNSEPDDFLVKCKFIDNIAKNIRVYSMVPQQDNIDIIMNHCRETGNMVFYDDLVQTLEWIYSSKT